MTRGFQVSRGITEVFPGPFQKTPEREICLDRIFRTHLSTAESWAVMAWLLQSGISNTRTKVKSRGNADQPLLR